MRAGQYAHWRGTEYAASFDPRESTVLLYAPPGTAPEGFSPDAWGEYRRVVDRSEVDRLEAVETVGVWQGRRVDVTSVRGQEARVSMWGDPPDHPAVKIRDRLDHWEARVPVSELTEVVETVTEVPL